MALAALFIPDGLPDWQVPAACIRWLGQPANAQWARDQLWGVTQAHLRVPGPPLAVYRNRLQQVTVLRRDQVEAAWPPAYAAPPWRGFAYTPMPFRDWHVVVRVPPGMTPDQVADLLERKAIHLHTNNEGLDWAHIGEARGLDEHVHMNVSFRHAIPQTTLRKWFGLAQTDKTTPIHGSFQAASDYISGQSLREKYVGVRPNRSIWVDGQRYNLSQWQALSAIEDGECTAVLPNLPRGRRTRPEARALEGWIRDKTQAGFSPTIHRAVDTADALGIAANVAADYSGRMFRFDFRQTLGVAEMSPPQGWFGEETVVLLNVPPEHRARQLRARWVRSAAHVVWAPPDTRQANGQQAQTNDHQIPMQLQMQLLRQLEQQTDTQVFTHRKGS